MARLEPELGWLPGTAGWGPVPRQRPSGRPVLDGSRSGLLVLWRRTGRADVGRLSRPGPSLGRR